MRSNQVRKLVYVIGMGPGNFEQMTFEARRALEQSDVIVGYTVYPGEAVSDHAHAPGGGTLPHGV